jgi:2-(1,2-epoxy-1,2-dihydrophenyl)acetyl-CoA isomerase
MSLLIQLENGIKTVSFNLPKKKNPVTIDMLIGLRTMLAESLADGTKVVILTGEGGNFSAGADLSGGAMDERFGNVTNYLRTYINPVVLAMRESPIPIIAKVQGVCVGVGFSLALACDMIFAEKTASFNQIFSKIGLATDGGGGFFMPRTLGYQKAFELVTQAAMISAEQGQQLGFVNQVFETATELEAHITQTSLNFSQAASVAIGLIKQNLNKGMNSTLAETMEQEAVNQGLCFQTEDFAEGVMAFLEKRKAVFKGK